MPHFPPFPLPAPDLSQLDAAQSRERMGQIGWSEQGLETVEQHAESCSPPEALHDVALIAFRNASRPEPPFHRHWTSPREYRVSPQEETRQALRDAGVPRRRLNQAMSYAERLTLLRCLRIWTQVAHDHGNAANPTLPPATPSRGSTAPTGFSSGTADTNLAAAAVVATGFLTTPPNP